MKDLRWFILEVSPLCEKAVANRLTRKLDPTWVTEEAWAGTTSGAGIVTYVPMVRRRMQRRHARRLEDWLPFPRYVFVGFETDPPWLFVFDVQGVQGVIGVDNAPFEIDATLVGGLMWHCETGQIRPPALPVIQKGMPVIVKSGVMRGCEGEVKKVHKQTGGLDVLLEQAGGKRLVTMRLDDVASVAYA